MEVDMTAGDIITTAFRVSINDPSAVRWTNSVLFQWLLEGETLVVNKHPESQYGTRVANSTPTLCTATTDSITVSSKWQLALSHYLAARCLESDADDSNNMKLSAWHMARFGEAL